jgi:hypothetical protein
LTKNPQKAQHDARPWHLAVMTVLKPCGLTMIFLKESFMAKHRTGLTRLAFGIGCVVLTAMSFSPPALAQNDQTQTQSSGGQDSAQPSGDQSQSGHHRGHRHHRSTDQNDQPN